MDVSRVSNGQVTNVDDDAHHAVPVESSMLNGENIHDSVLDHQMHIPTALRGAAKVLDNQQSMSLAASQLIDEPAAPSEQAQTRRQSQKATTIKKLTENQKNLFRRCSAILKEVNDEMTASEKRMAACQ